MKKIVHKKDDPRIKISDYLKDRGTKIIWLSGKTGISMTHLHFIFKRERSLTDKNKEKINKALETNF